jgi:hypothetical protein
MHVADNVARHALLDVEVDEARLSRELRVRAEHDLPHITLRKRLAVLVPLDHAFDELLRDAVFAIDERKCGACVCLVDVATACTGKGGQPDG